jgi:hypothetical protein
MSLAHINKSFSVILECPVISHFWRLCGLLRARLTLRRRETNLPSHLSASLRSVHQMDITLNLVIEFVDFLEKAAIGNTFSRFSHSPGQQIPLYSLTIKNIKLITVNINTASLKSRSSSLPSLITCKTNLCPLNTTELKRRLEIISTMMT